MVRTVRIGVVAYSSPGWNLTRWQHADLVRLFGPDRDGLGLADYWAAGTTGLIRVDIAFVLPWHDLAADSELATTVVTADRTQVCQALTDDSAVALRLPSEVDALVLMVHDTRAPAGATSVRLGGRTIPAALLSCHSAYDFLAHEVGHVLGFPHSYGFTTPTYPFGEYGDPYCVMSAMTFGGRRDEVTWESTPGAGWSPDAAQSPTWKAMPPLPARAMVWRHALPLWPLPMAGVEVRPWPTGLVDVELAAAPGSPWLVALGPRSESRGFVCLELRPAVGWDRGLDLRHPQVGGPAERDTSDAPGVVVHRVLDLLAVEHGEPVWRRDQVSYSGTIPVPASGDLDTTSDLGGLVVRLVSAAPDGSRARVVVGPADQLGGRAVTLDREISAHDVVTTPGPTVDVMGLGVTCSTASVQMQRVAQRVRVRFTASSTGFRKPRFGWRVGDLPVGTGPLGLEDALSGGVLAPRVTVHTPTADGSSAPVERTVAATARAAWNVLELEFPSGDGWFEVPVRVEVSDLGHTVPTARADATAWVSTLSLAVPPEVADARRRCTEWLRAAVRGVVEIDDRPDGVRGPGWGRRDVEDLRRRLDEIHELELRSPFLADRAIRELGAAVGLTRDQLDAVRVSGRTP